MAKFRDALSHTSFPFALIALLLPTMDATTISRTAYSSRSV